MDICSKSSSLQCSWVKNVYDQKSHNWKLIPIHFIDKIVSGKKFTFHSNLSFKTSVLHQFPTFYTNILQLWKINFSNISHTASCIGSHFLLFNNYIQLITIMFTLYNLRITVLTLSISYLHPRENAKTRTTSKENFNSQIIYIRNLHKFPWKS